MAAKTSPAMDLSALASLPIGLLNAMITPHVMELVKKRLDLDDEKLALMLVRLINPDEVLTQTEEANLRGLRPETLRSYKDAGEFPRHLGGITAPVKG